MGLSTLAGHSVTKATLTLPAWGRWFAEVSLTEETTLSGAVDFVIEDRTFKGFVLSGGPTKGRSNYRIVGGSGGWGKTIRKDSYANDAGVKASTVIADAAKLAGEKIDATTLPSDRVGPAFTRKQGIAAHVLELVVPGRWYVDEAGVTKIGKRPVTPYTGTAARVSLADKARARVELAPTTLAGLVPGAVVDGIEAVDVVHEVGPKGLRTRIYGKRGGVDTSRGLAVFKALLDQLDPDRNFRAVWEYRVATLSGKRVNLQPVLVSTGMPDLQRVPLRPGLAGSRSDLALGSRVLVGFINADPGMPYVAALEDAEGAGYKPVLTEIDAQTVIRLGGTAAVRPIAALGDLAGGIWPVGTTQTKAMVP